MKCPIPWITAQTHNQDSTWDPTDVQLYHPIVKATAWGIHTNRAQGPWRAQLYFPMDVFWIVPWILTQTGCQTWLTT